MNMFANKSACGPLGFVSYNKGLLISCLNL